MTGTIVVASRDVPGWAPLIRASRPPSASQVTAGVSVFQVQEAGGE